MEVRELLNLIEERSLIQGSVKITMGDQSLVGHKGFYFAHGDSYLLFLDKDGGAVSIEMQLITDYEIIVDNSVPLSDFKFKDYNDEVYNIKASSKENALSVADSYTESLNVDLEIIE